MEYKFNEQGLIPVITIDNESGKVLMLAYMNQEAIDLTLETGKVHYYSRSRDKMWLKGETSGHFQYLKSLTADCDNDTLLAKVEQIGVACHTGSQSCFFNSIEDRGGINAAIIIDEERNIIERKKQPKAGSYTNYLFDNGVDKICKKIGEEATEVVLAAKNNDSQGLIGEVCDLLYHVQVLLANQDIKFCQVMEEMQERRCKQNNLKPKNTKGEM